MNVQRYVRQSDFVLTVLQRSVPTQYFSLSNYIEPHFWYLNEMINISASLAASA
jgi:hypothetical protein